MAEGTRLPAHSQYIAFHSHFIQQLIHETGPISWQDPLVIKTALEGHSYAAISMLLAGVYQQGVLNLSSAQEAWQMYKLADHLDCPSMLQQCREYINSSSGAALIDTSSEAALEWILAAHELGWEGLRTQCAESIARNYHSWEADARFASLPSEVLTLIMHEMAKQRSMYEAEVMNRVQLVLEARSGRVLCRTKHSQPYAREDKYKFFCDKIECPGHELVASTTVNHRTPAQLYRTRLQGTVHCDESSLSQLIGERIGASTESSDAAHSVLPDFLQKLLQLGYDQMNE